MSNRGSYVQLSTAENGANTDNQGLQLSDRTSLGSARKRNVFKTSNKLVVTKRDTVLIGIVVALILVAIAVSLAIGLPKLQEKKLRYENTTIPVSSSVLHSFQKAVVISDGAPCAAIGKEALLKGGTAVDAAIATLFCGGVVNPQSMGLGGGFIMTIYHKENKTVDVIDGRETAPGKATQDMYSGNSTLSQKGGLAVAVPGELRGYKLAHDKYGKLNWSELVMPSVKLCREGYQVSEYLAWKLRVFKDDIMAEESMRSLFYNNATMDVFKHGETIFNPELGETLEVIANEGGDALYNGTLAEKLVNDVQQFGGIITLEDMEKYQAQSQNSISVPLRDGKVLHTVPPPGSGAILTLIMAVLNEYNLTSESFDDLDNRVLMFHRMIETYKHSYALRTELGDLDFVNVTDVLRQGVSRSYAERIRSSISDETTFESEHYGATLAFKEDHGTAHLSVLAENGDAVSVTSTVNTQFGAMIRSQSTGIILNSEMDDFSSPNITNYFGVPPSPANFIEPHKRPMSSMCPAIIIDKNFDVDMVLGGAGGTRIITATALVASLSLWMKKDIKEAIDAPRFHHQLYPNFVQHEKSFPQIYLDKLQKFGHNSIIDDQASMVMAIAKNGSNKIANIDFRKGGSVEGY